MAKPGTWLSDKKGGWYIVNDRGVPQPARRYAMELLLEGKKVPPRPPEAKGFRLLTDQQRAMFKAMRTEKYSVLSFSGLVKYLSTTLTLKPDHKEKEKES